MAQDKIYLGKNELNTSKAEVSGQFVEIDNEKYYRISNYQEMPDFFISIVSDADHWMFISSNGSLSAGRKDRNNALFPYYTVDKIHDYKGITGNKSCFRVEQDGKMYVWEPFSEESENVYRISRNLYKNYYGNKILFEEVNDDLGLTFRYGWSNSDKFGFVKTSTLTNNSKSSVAIDVLDGIRNILPYGIDYNFQNEYSNLLDAYKKNERIEGSNLGLFMLSSIPVDRAEPSEALKVTTVWSYGPGKESKILISDKQLSNFRNGLTLKTENDIRASRGAYYINTTLTLEANSGQEWLTIADINQDSTDVFNLNRFIRETNNLESLVKKDIEQGTNNLKKKVAFADGFQMTATDMCYARHYSNTLYNIMRGGIFIDNYLVDTNDFRKYLSQINKLVSKQLAGWVNDLPEKISYTGLVNLAKEAGDADLLRITNEYLPLTFSRRHGDPSRPWNLFSIETKNADGSVKFNYEGNWRDIFQNWEALCYSFPEFIEGIISKFVNASTIDGYNPYRIMRKGIDWECPDPDDPWAYIGYWGDHQIIYLQKLLELSDDFHPGKLDEMLVNDIFVYANVPYRIKPYSKIIQNPSDTVVFDHNLNDKIKNEETHLGGDASLLKQKGGDQIYKVNFTEKILVSLLSKLSNFIPEAGIWLNTQRPEWNDANNALVGNGTSMVTLYYIRRFLKFWEEKFSSVKFDEISVSEEVATLFESISGYLKANETVIKEGFTNSDRRDFADYLGQSHSKFRNEVYNYSFSGEKAGIQTKDLVSFISLCIKYIDQSIQVNKRDDGLYHAYNLISVSDESISIRHLYEMLEGQVSVLSAGLLSPSERLDLLNSLKKSKIFREDQYSYMLYPDRQLPRFMEKNTIPENLVNESLLLTKLLEDKESSIIDQDDEGNYHFNGTFRNADALKIALDNLHVGSYSQLIEAEREKLMAIYEEVFDHQSFTGRSGRFYGYEGLGSIYWHMVSKLLLATQDAYFKALEEGTDAETVNRLKDHYYEIKAGIGLYKSPDLYGAFPMDAYSHTPGNAGVKQPGLTGQVKEDFISRLLELGIHIKKGTIVFNPELINQNEFLKQGQDFEFMPINGTARRIKLEKNQMAYTFCQVPIIYNISYDEWLEVNFNDNEKSVIPGNFLDAKLSSKIFNRTGEIDHLIVNIKPNK